MAKKNSNVWDEILKGDRLLSDKDAKQMLDLVKELRKEE